MACPPVWDLNGLRPYAGKCLIERLKTSIAIVAAQELELVDKLTVIRGPKARRYFEEICVLESTEFQPVREP